MIVHTEMENSDFSFAQECLNDRVPSQHSASPFIDDCGYPRYPNGYSTLILHMATVHTIFSYGYSRLNCFTYMTPVKIVQ